MMIAEILSFLRNRIPGQLVIQLTDRCNACCPQCGMRVTEPFPRSRLDVDTVKRIIDHAASNGVKAVSFTGGEPFLYFKDLVKLIQHADHAGIDYIRTGTNGFLFTKSRDRNFEPKIHGIADQLARTPLRNFWISIDSASPAMHESMRGFPGIVRGIEKGLPIFHGYGIYPSANLGINRNMGGQPIAPPAVAPTRMEAEYRRFFLDAETAFRRFFRFIVNLGFTIVNACYPMSVDADASGNSLEAVYLADSKDAVVSFTAFEKAMLFKALSTVIPVYRSLVRIFTPLCSLHALSARQMVPGRDWAYPCRGGVDFFFINASDGDTYPCGYRGAENLGKFWNVSLNKVKRPAFCRQCEWECFRDPSELLSPIAEMIPHPFAFLRKLFMDSTFFQLWISDIRYYRACHYFNGRIPPDSNRLAHFRRKNAFSTKPAVSDLSPGR